MNVKRREAIRRTSIIIGGALSTSAVSAVMSGCKATPTGPDWTPSFLNEEQGAMVAELAERIIPTTDTPGAKDAGVHYFIDIFLKDCAEPDEQSQFKSGLEDIANRAKKAHGKSFTKLSAEQIDGILEELAKAPATGKTDEELADELANEGESVQGDPFDPSRFFNGLRQLVVLGYFTSEVGANQALKMDQIPGEYHGCIDYAEVGGAWAL